MCNILKDVNIHCNFSLHYQHPRPLRLEEGWVPCWPAWQHCPASAGSPVSASAAWVRGEQYLSWNIAKAIYCIIWKYCIWSNIQKYRDILTIFVMYDFGHFWPEIDLKTIATHQFSCILACNLLNSWNCIKFLSVCDESTVQKSGKWKP